jgi:hypothetical protein
MNIASRQERRERILFLRITPGPVPAPPRGRGTAAPRGSLRWGCAFFTACHRPVRTGFFGTALTRAPKPLGGEDVVSGGVAIDSGRGNSQVCSFRRDWKDAGRMAVSIRARDGERR